MQAPLGLRCAQAWPARQPCEHRALRVSAQTIEALHTDKSLPSLQAHMSRQVCKVQLCWTGAAPPGHLLPSGVRTEA